MAGLGAMIAAVLGASAAAAGPLSDPPPAPGCAQHPQECTPTTSGLDLPRPGKARFELTLTGEQVSTYGYDWVGESSDPPYETYGCHEETSESVSFATPRPVKVTVKVLRFKEPSGGHRWHAYNTWFAFGPGGPRGWGDPSIDVRADLERRVASTGDPRCYRLDPAGQVNCSRSAEAVNWWLTLEGVPELRRSGRPPARLRQRYDPNDVMLGDEPARNPSDPFPDCAGRGLEFAFPDMAFSAANDSGHGGEPTAKVSPGQVLDPDAKRIVIRGGDEETFSEEALYPDDPSERRSTRLDYTISLKRLGRK